MKKNNYYLISGTIIFTLIVAGIFFIIRGKKLNISEKNANQTNIENLNFLKDYLTQNFDGNYPLPKGDVILLDKDLQQIHLEDKTQKAEAIENLYVVQGTLGGLNIDDKQFKDKIYDKRFSLGENKRYFTYSVTKDRKHFQLATLDNKDDSYYAYIIGNMSGSIIRDFESQNIVQNNQNKYLPYMATSNNKYMVKLIKGNIEDFSITQDDNPTLKKSAKELTKGLFLPLGDNVTQLSISAKGDDYVYKIIYPNGNIQLISPSANGESQIQLNYESDGIKSKANIVNTLGKIAYNMVKLSDDSDYQIQDNKGGVLVIRGTQFTVDIDENQSSTYLMLGSINLTKRNQKYLLTVSNNIAGFDKNDQYLDMFKFPEKVKNLFSYGVAMDIFLNPQPKLTINKINSNNNDIVHPLLSGISLDSIYEIKNEIGKSYYGVSLKGYFQTQTAIEIAKNKSYINNIMQDVCRRLGYQKNIGLESAYDILILKDLKKDYINFEINTNLKNIIPQNTILPFYSSVKDNSSLVFYDYKTHEIAYKSISSYAADDKRDGIFLICK